MGMHAIIVRLTELGDVAFAWLGDSYIYGSG